MATGFTNYKRQADLTTLTASTLYLGFHSADPGATGANELTIGVNGYARATVASSDWGTATTADPAVVTNDTEVSVPTSGTSSGDWNGGTAMSYASLWTHATNTGAQYCVFILELDTPFSMLTGQSKTIAVGDLTLNFSMTA